MTNGLARYIMIGGFLGAGKTTSIGKLAEHLTQQGLKVGLITNDQGHHLVDTMNLASHGYPVEEIPGGCFCCRFNSLRDAAENLTRDSRPDVFIAEPVGSCTDLIASVSYPLRRIYGDRYRVAPLSVVVDPIRAQRVLGLSDGKGFSEKVTYIYLKQLEEAAVIVINKTDMLSDAETETLRAALGERFPQAEVLACSARNGAGLADWFEKLNGEEQPGGETMDVDYQIYAEGEALLGWLNATIELEASEAVDGDELLQDLAERVRGHLDARDIEVAHFKMTLSPHDESGEIAVLSLVGNSYRAELSQSLADPLNKGQIIVNLRAEGEPEQLETAVTKALAEVAGSTLKLELDHLERFKPGEPVPVYRMKHDQEEITA